MISLLLGRFKGWIIAGFALLVAFGEAYRRGRKAGVEKIEAEQEAARKAAREQRKAIDDELSNVGHADLDDRLSRWLRR